MSRATVKKGRAHPERVPDFVVLFFELFPEALPIAQEQHAAATDGLCKYCGKTSPCPMEVWVRNLAPPKEASAAVPVDQLADPLPGVAG